MSIAYANRVKMIIKQSMMIKLLMINTFIFRTIFFSFMLVMKLLELSSEENVRWIFLCKQSKIMTKLNQVNVGQYA